MKTKNSFNLVKLFIILTLGAQFSACAPTATKRDSSASALSDGSGEYRVTFDKAGFDYFYVMAFDSGQVEATLYFFPNSATIHPYAGAYTRRKLGTYAFNGSTYKITWAYETCKSEGHETSVLSEQGTLQAQLGGASMDLDRLDGFTHWLKYTVGLSSVTEDKACTLIP